MSFPAAADVTRGTVGDRLGTAMHVFSCLSAGIRGRVVSTMTAIDKIAKSTSRVKRRTEKKTARAALNRTFWFHGENGRLKCHC
jgi:hypothetical protein